MLLLSRTELQRLQDPGGHGVDQWQSVGHNVVPLGVVPGGLTTRLPVRQRLVAPEMVDGVQLAQLGEQAAVRDVLPDRAPVL